MTFEQARDKFEGKFCQDEWGVYLVLKIKECTKHCFKTTDKIIEITFIDETSMKEESHIYRLDSFCQENTVVE